MSDYEKHVPHTDALDTLGTIITPNEKRDAIHLAVYPVEAGEMLVYGMDVKLGEDGRAYSANSSDGVGIVDPFLETGVVKTGQWFWLVVYPRQIHSLRHVWEHPSFPPSGETGEEVVGKFTLEYSDLIPTDTEQLESGEYLVNFFQHNFAWFGPDDSKKAFDLWIESMLYGGYVAPGYVQAGQNPGPQPLNDDWSAGGEYIHFKGEDAHGKVPEELWHHLEVYTGKVPHKKAKYFSCSC